MSSIGKRRPEDEVDSLLTERNHLLRILRIFHRYQLVIDSGLRWSGAAHRDQYEAILDAIEETNDIFRYSEPNP